MKRTKWLALMLSLFAALFMVVPLTLQANYADGTAEALGGDATAHDAIDPIMTAEDTLNPFAVAQPNANSGANPDMAWTVYVVKRGDTLSQIAAKFGCTVAQIMRANAIKNPNRIYVGQRLKIPTAGSAAVRPTHTHQTDDLRLAVCNPSVAISWPRNNEVITTDSLEIKGAVGLPAGFDPGSNGFSYYKVEWGVGERPILWNVVGALHNNAVPDGWLETWNTAGLANGIYKLRLFAVSTRGQFPAPCEVRVEIKR